MELTGAGVAEFSVQGRQTRDDVAPVRHAVVGTAAAAAIAAVLLLAALLEAEVPREGFVADSRGAVGVQLDVVADVP